MSTLEFYGGVNEVGGNKIKVNLDSTSLLLDFGMSFNQAGKYFAEFMSPRKGNGLEDYLEMGLIPDIKGIYREDYLRHKGLPFEDKPAVDGLLLSHAHADHADYIGFLRNDIPIYMSLNSRIILEVIDAIGYGSKEILTYKPEFRYYINNKGGYSERKLKKGEILPERDIRVLEPYKKETINNLDVQLAPVDHSLPGAAAYLIEGSEERIVYTGDLRFHGRNKKDSERFVKEASKFSPNIMICEGTRIGSGEHHEEGYFEFEEDIEKGAYELINGFSGLIIANFPLRDLDRLITFYNIAKSTDRILLITLNQAYMLNLIKERNAEKTIYPTLDDEHIGVYIPRKGKGAYPYDTFVSLVDDDADDEWIPSNKEIALKDYAKWERDYLDLPNAVNSSDIRENECQYILRLDNFTFKELIDIKPENAIYIHSVTEPFNDEMELSYEITENWLNHFNIPINKSFHVSGHARGAQLLDMIREINPDVLYPVHTTRIELFDVLKDDGIEVIHPKNLNDKF